MSSPFGPRKKPDPDQDLATTIDQILGDDPEFKRLTQKLKRAQQRLKKLCSDPAWTQYLLVESEANARADRGAHLVLQHGLKLAKRNSEPGR